MNRRDFMNGALGVAGAGMVGAAAPRALGSTQVSDTSRGGTRGRAFRMKYAPHFGMFSKHAPGGLVDQVKFMADQGFRAMEDNGMARRSVEDQTKVRAELDRQGMEMGVFVASAEFRKPTFVSGNQGHRDKILGDIRKAIEVAKRVHAKWVTVVPGGYHQGMEEGYQTANAVETLKRCAELCEKTGLVMVLEPLNPWTNHAGVFLTKIPQAYLICRAVGSPSCKILFDIYHQQITEGNLIPNMNKSWDEIGYFQIGDNPGRKEPTTGEINYRNVFRHIHGRKFTGILGMEHGNSKKGKEGELAVIEAYRQSDDF